MPAQLAYQDPETDLETDRLSQAARFVTHLQLQLAELDRREQQLNEQANLLFEQQLVAKRAAKAAQDQLVQQRRELQQQAEVLAESEETLRQRVLVLRQQEEDFARRFTSLQAERDQYQQQQAEDQAHFQEELRLKREEFQEEQRRWHEAQERLKEQFRAEQASSEQRLTDSRLAFQAEQERIRQTIEAEQAGAWDEVEQHRIRFAEEMERERAQLQSLQRDLEENQARERAEWITQRDGQQAELDALKDDLQLQRSEQERLNLQWIEHRKEEKRQHLETLEEISRTRLGSLDLREREIQQREIDLQKRFRLHEDHLERARRDLSVQKSEMEWREQQQRIWIEQVESSIRMRLGQMRRFRDLLTQREKSLVDEQHLFQKQRVEVEQQLQHQRENLTIERVRTAEIRKEEVRTLLERQAFLDQELEQIADDRRQAVEVTAQFSQILQQLHAAIQESPNDLPASHLTQLMQIVSQQIVELEESRKQLTEQQQHQRAENIRLSAWIESREAWVQEREAVFSQQLAELSKREQICQTEREAWHKERIQVEQLIRQLVQQIESASSTVS